jgi:hypothetical protein
MYSTDSLVPAIGPLHMRSNRRAVEHQIVEDVDFFESQNAEE